jgi:hypothetical protein
VFCALSQRRIIGALFLYTTVTSWVYIELFWEFVNQTICNSHSTITNKMELQATLLVWAWLKSNHFSQAVISRGLWPPRSPDLTPPDFFLWGSSKGRAYMNKPRILDELRENIRREFQRFWQTPPETCNVVFGRVLTLREGISSTSCDNRISYRNDIQMYCTFVLFVKHFLGLPATGTHCTSEHV